MQNVEKHECFGLVRPEHDIHTLGLTTISKLLKDIGIRSVIGDQRLAKSVSYISKLENQSYFTSWIYQNQITRLGFSYRLDPDNAQAHFGKVYHALKLSGLMRNEGGPINQVYFAGLPAACQRIDKEYNGEVITFMGDETQFETLVKLGISIEFIPDKIAEHSLYDSTRLAFAKSYIESGNHNYGTPVDRSGYPEYGTKKDSIVARIGSSKKNNDSIPLFRAHVGPYSDDYGEAKKEFLNWLNVISQTGYLDIVSIGSSQLTQSHFGENWNGLPNGGGVPIQSIQDLDDIWNHSRPLLLRMYSSTKNVPKTVNIFEKHINIAWHALSFWWFNVIDGRGPNSVRDGLVEHFEAVEKIAQTGKPLEPNIPHHFSFRGGDEYTYILSSYLAAKAAKRLGIKTFVVQTMLNTPKYTLGLQDIAKTRALYTLIKELEDATFRVYLQPRAGLDYFSPDIQKAKLQLASVSAMMDDILTTQDFPEIIHVVSYSEAIQLATPAIINESVQITQGSLLEYRSQKNRGLLPDYKRDPEIAARTKKMIDTTKEIVFLLERNVNNLYSPNGFYQLLKLGVLTAPYMWECREEFSEAIKWKTDFMDGGIHVVDDDGTIIDPISRIQSIFS
jgi:hypothetical protein